MAKRRGRLASCRSQRQRSWDRRTHFECLEPRKMLTSLPYGAVAHDTGEYMLGDVVATVVFFESDGSRDPSTEDWNPLVRDAQAAMSWSTARDGPPVPAVRI